MKNYSWKSQQTRQLGICSKYGEEEDKHGAQNEQAAAVAASDTAPNGSKRMPCHLIKEETRPMKNSNRRHVHFGVVLVREHSLTIGDHPMCNDPLPLTLDWMHTDEQQYDINIYEATRTLRCSIRQEKERRASCNRNNLSSNNAVYDRATKLCYWKRRDLLKHQLHLSNKEMVDLELSLAQKLS